MCSLSIFYALPIIYLSMYCTVQYIYFTSLFYSTAYCRSRCYIPELNTQRQDVNFYSPHILSNNISLYQYTLYANRNKHVFLFLDMEAETGEDSLIIILQKR